MNTVTSQRTVFGLPLACIVAPIAKLNSYQLNYLETLVLLEDFPVVRVDWYHGHVVNHFQPSAALDTFLTESIFSHKLYID